jgi:hypothetical protein
MNSDSTIKSKFCPTKDMEMEDIDEQEVNDMIEEY